MVVVILLHEKCKSDMALLKRLLPLLVIKHGLCGPLVGWGWLGVEGVDIEGGIIVN